MTPRGIAYVLALAGSALFGTALVASRSEAAVVIDITQSGSDVVTTGSGNLDINGLTFVSTSFTSGAMIPAQAVIVVGPAGVATNLDLYSAISGPSSFGSGAFTEAASSGSRDIFGISIGRLVVPANYVSGTSLSGTDTYTNTTISSLGLTPGTYVYTWGTVALACGRCLLPWRKGNDAGAGLL